MSEVTIAVASLFPDIFAVCKESVDKYAAKYKKLLIIDQDPELIGDVHGCHDTSGWEVVISRLPYIGSRLGNIVLGATWPDDIFALGDDVQLLDFDVEKLRDIAYSDPTIGIVAPRVYGACGCELQRANSKQFKNTNWVETQERIAFIAVYIKREVIDKVGMLDTRFYGYGGDDTDYCMRTQMAGYKLAIALNCFVKHGFGESQGTMTWGRLGNRMNSTHIEMHLALEKKWQGVMAAKTRC